MYLQQVMVICAEMGIYAEGGNIEQFAWDASDLLELPMPNEPLEPEQWAHYWLSHYQTMVRH